MHGYQYIHFYSHIYHNETLKQDRSITRKEKYMAYYYKLNDIKAEYQKRYEHCYNALKAWEKSCVPVYKKDGKELKSKKKAFPELSFSLTYGGNIKMSVYFLVGYYHDYDDITIYNKYCDINELSYDDILAAVNKHVDGLKGSCEQYFQVLTFIDESGNNLYNDLKSVLESYDESLPGYLKYLVYEMFEPRNSLCFCLTEDLLIKKGTYSKDFSEKTLKAMLECAGFREKAMIENYDYYKEYSINDRSLIKLFDSKTNNSCVFDKTFNKWVA